MLFDAAQTPALLKGIIFGPTGAAMSPTHTRKGNRLYRCYVSQDGLKRGPDACPVRRVPAAEIEAAVIDQLRGIFRQPEIVVGTWRAARAERDDVPADEHGRRCSSSTHCGKSSSRPSRRRSWAFRWRKMLNEGVHATIEDLAKAKGTGKTYVSQVLRLTLVSPEIVEAILNGRQPVDLHLERNPISLHRTLGGLAQQRLQLGEGVLDRIEIGAAAVRGAGRPRPQ